VAGCPWGLKNPRRRPYSISFDKDSYVRIQTATRHSPGSATSALARCGGLPSHGDPALRGPPQEHQGARVGHGVRPAHHAGRAKGGSQRRACGRRHVRHGRRFHHFANAQAARWHRQSARGGAAAGKGGCHHGCANPFCRYRLPGRTARDAGFERTRGPAACLAARVRSVRQSSTRRFRPRF
jgi:hypothetical protein